MCIFQGEAKQCGRLFLQKTSQSMHTPDGCWAFRQHLADDYQGHETPCYCGRSRFLWDNQRILHRIYASLQAPIYGFEKKCETTLEKVKAELKNATSKITLTIDAWTSIATKAYLGVSCNFINQDRELTSYSLTTMPLEECHTAEILLAGWKRHRKKHGIASDC